MLNKYGKKYDEIRIDGLQIFAHHGVYDFETRDGQNFYVNAVLYTDTRKAGKTDELTDSTNYGEVCQFLTEFLTSNTYKLLEAALEHAASGLLHRFPLIQGVDLELCKPEAPIPLPFESVSVCVRRFWHTAYVALGSNMGDKKKYLDDALKELQQNADIRLVETASYFITEPYGGVKQDEFLNSVCCIETLLSPEELLDELHCIEQQAQRKREIHWGPRTLDLDIIYYDDVVMATEELVIPHPDMANRTFVLEPLCEIAPYMRHPIMHKTNREMLDELPKNISYKV